MNFRVVEMNQQHGDDAGAVDLVQRNRMGQFTPALRSVAPSSPVHVVDNDAIPPAPVLPYNPQMLAILQAAGTPPRSPLPVSPAKQNKNRRRRCDVCKGLYVFGSYSDHIKKKKHRDACKVDSDSDV